MRALHTVCCGLVVVLGITSVAIADDSQPIVVHVKELRANIYQVMWQVPMSVSANSVLTIVLPDECKDVTAPTTRPARPTRTGQSLYRCKSGLSGESIGIRFPLDNPSILGFLKYQTQTGELHTVLSSPQTNRWQIPTHETKADVALNYTRLGIVHIWAGMDHLLFLLCLLFIAGDARRVLITITGFTLAHSVTLGLSALGLIHVPIRPTEAVIALSIVFLATEIVKNKKDSLTWRHPIAVSSSFGLIHGLGFAAVLSEMGLPQVELYTGLLFFNLGVEAGQILFVTAVFLLLRLGKRFFDSAQGAHRMLPSMRLGASYMIGGLASFWLIERMA